MNSFKELVDVLSGEWEGVTRTWFEPDILADEAANSGSIRPILGGRFLLHEYQSTLKGKAFEGLVIYGFDTTKGKFVSAWVDSAHMGTDIMISEGDEKEHGFWVLGHYEDVQSGTKWGWRTEIDVLGSDQIIITAYNIFPSGQEARAVETRYKRKSNSTRNSS